MHRKFVFFYRLKCIILLAHLHVRQIFTKEFFLFSNLCLTLKVFYQWVSNLFRCCITCSSVAAGAFKIIKIKPLNHSLLLFTDQDNTSIIVAITVPLALILLLLVTIIFVRRRRNGGRKATKETRANDNMSLADSVVETNRPILIKNFADHYRKMSADSDFR